MKKSEEEKVAERLANLVKDSTLNLDQVGEYLGRMLPSYLLKRLVMIAEAGEYEREMEDLRNNNGVLF